MNVAMRLLHITVAVAGLTVTGFPAAAGEAWHCAGADGTLVSIHPDENAARESCQRRAQAAAGGIFLVAPASAGGTPVAKPVAPKSLPCRANGTCLANLPLSGRLGSWSWVAPTQLEKGDIHTDLVRFAMMRQPVGGEPEEVAEISAKVTNVFWGMDIRDANACFWIEAVRIHSAPMPSDRSNRICLDADGQLLPKA